jgi:hypothetical protein
VAVHEVELELSHIGFIGLDLSFVLLDQEFLVGDGLFGDGLLLAQFFEARKIGMRLTHRRLILEQRSFGLLQVDFELARIDLGEKLILRHILAFPVADLRQIAAQHRQHGHRVGGRHRAKLREHFRHVAAGRLGDLDYLRRRTLCGGLGLEYMHDDEDEQDRAQHAQYQTHTAAARFVFRRCVHRCVHTVSRCRAARTIVTLPFAWKIQRH